MDTILAMWSEVRVGVRTLTSFCTALTSPETEDELGWAGDADWNVYQDLLSLAGFYTEEQLDADTFEALVDTRLQGLKVL